MRKPIVSFTLLGMLVAGGFAQPRLLVEAHRVTSAPVRLSSSDGVGMRLTRYEAKVVMQGPLAFTQLHLRFHNPQDRVLEGRFSITLPEGAALSRLAMKNEQGWQEAEVVELQQARAAYEDFLHRRQDPALLEKQAGNEFQARIFPLPAAGDKEIILSYSQEVTGDYRLPVSGLPKVDDLSVQASLDGKKLDYSLHGEAPKGDFVITGKAGPAGMVSGEEILVVVKPQVQNPQAQSFDLLVLVDTSASRAAGYGAQVDKVKQLLAEWKRRHPGARVRLAAFDQQVVPLASPEQLLQRRPLGATDLAAALRWASSQDIDRIVLVSDGVSTAGSETLSANHRLDALMVGGIRDTSVLQPLAHGHGGFVLEGRLPLGQLVARLEGTPASGLKVNVAGADWVWPPVLDGVAPGESRVVYAHLKQPAQKVEVSLGQAAPYTQALTPASRPLLHRSVVAANLARLNRQRLQAKGDQKEQIARHMVEISTGNRVVCDLTGLLVLETDTDYQRFKINRSALADIMVVGDNDLELQHRSQAVVMTQTPAKPEKMELETAKQAYQNRDKGEELAGNLYQSRLPAAGATQINIQDADPANRPVASPEPASPAPGAAARRPRPESAPPPPPPAPPVEEPRSESIRESVEEERPKTPPLNGPYKEIDSLLRHGKVQQALLQARRWQAKEPGDVLALVALGRSLQAGGQLAEASRAYGSIIDLYPGRADLRRYAGGLLESLGKPGQSLACDSYRQSVKQRPDHPSGSRMLAYNLVRQGQYQQAFEVLEKALHRNYPDGRFAQVQSVLRDDLGLVAAALIAHNPDLRTRIVKKLHALGVPLANKPSLRFVLTWETDANDVDFHIQDAQGGHAFYSQPDLPSGGHLYGDVTTGYGPECFNIPGGGRAFPYKISIHYYSRGPMGYGMGKVEIVRHDGQGHFRFEQRPFVVMNDSAYVELGSVKD